MFQIICFYFLFLNRTKLLVDWGCWLLLFSCCCCCCCCCSPSSSSSSSSSSSIYIYIFFSSLFLSLFILFFSAEIVKAKHSRVDPRGKERRKERNRKPGKKYVIRNKEPIDYSISSPKLLRLLRNAVISVLFYLPSLERQKFRHRGPSERTSNVRFLA